MQALYIMYNWEHEKHFYESTGKRFDFRTGLEEGYKLVGLTGNPLGCFGCPVLEDEHH